MEIAFVLVGLVAGMVIGYFYARLKSQNQPIDNSAFETEIQTLRAQLNEAEKKSVELQARLDTSLEVFKKQDLELKLEREKSNDLVKQVENFKSQSQFLEQQKGELKANQEKMRKEFEGIAASILKENTKEFSANNEKRLGEILNPFKDSIKDFEKKVDEAYKQEFRDKASLKEEVKKLFELNQNISQVAKNLTNAVKGDSKKQGNWGEIILERVLEQSGLEKGREYETQFSTTNEEGNRIQPDVIIHLPENKHIIVDSKVSLKAYEAYVSSESEEERIQYLKAHVLSVKTHIKQLSEKNYQTGAGIQSPDFVLLFMPIEAAFGLAVQNDTNLFSDAWNLKIVVVSPTTLLATLRTISSIWKQERQNKNALEIAEVGGRLYDKIRLFVEDMEKIDKHLDNTKKAYDDAMNKLSTGRGNILSRTEKIRKLGASVKKELPEIYLDDENE